MVYYKIHLTWNILKQGEKHCTTAQAKTSSKSSKFLLTTNSQRQEEKELAKFELYVLRGKIVF